MTNKTTAEQILDLMSTKINEMTELIMEQECKAYLERNNRVYVHSEYDIKCIRMSLIIDLLKSIEKYTLPSDLVKSLRSDITPKGFTITATIDRDGIDYRFSTDVIIAGGYNIQCLHYRYITNTNMPRIIASFELTNKYKDELKSINAKQRVINEITYKQQAIARYQKDSIMSAEVNELNIKRLNKDIQKLEEKLSKLN
jgi:hypothetical protein